MVSNESNEVPPMPRPYKIDGDPPVQPPPPVVEEVQEQQTEPRFEYGRGTLFIITLNVLVFICMMVTHGIGSFMNPTNAACLEWGANYGPLTTSGQWWRLTTSTFVHDGIMHIGMNMAVLSYIGSIVERLYGTPRFFVIYLVAGLGGSLVSMYMQPQALCMGASGAVLGCVGAYISLLRLDRNEQNKHLVDSSLRSFTSLALLMIVTGFFRAHTDNWGHIGGFVSGVLIGAFVVPKRTGVRTR